MQAYAEGFALTQWSARGTALSDGLVARGGDPSSIAYNAATITNLEGTQVAAGMLLVSANGKINADIRKEGGLDRVSASNHADATIYPQAYITHKLNDKLWLGFGVFSRFGVDNEYGDNWVGRYNVTDISLYTVSAVPTLAFKVNDRLSLSLGIEAMYASFDLNSQVPVMTKDDIFDNKMYLDATDWGYGVHLGALLKITDKLDLGLAYKSRVKLDLNGDVSFARTTDNQLADQDQVPHSINSRMSGDLILPDSIALALNYQILDNLSFEIGTMWTNWSQFDSLNFHYDSDFTLKNRKNFKDGWKFNASVEYSPKEWLTLRGGIWHETKIMDEAYADYLFTSNGGTGIALGVGFNWDNWNLDMAYSHIWIDSLEIYNERLDNKVSNIAWSKCHDTTSDNFSVTVSYKF